MDRKYIESTVELTDFIADSPSAFHVVANASRMLEDEGFERLEEDKPFCLKPGNGYYVTRNGSALIAFWLPEAEPAGFAVASAHTDAPCFKLKENPEMGDLYTTLNVEGYGGMLMAPWFDRPLSIAGRAFVRTEGGVESRLVDLDRDLCQITSLCIHQNREANKGYEYKIQKDMFPILGAGKNPGAVKELVASELDVSVDDIVDMELFLYNRQKAVVWGLDEEFFSSPKIDDLMCAFSALKALVESGASASSKIQMAVLFDNEEVGSGTKQGAAGTFMVQVMNRILASYGFSYDKNCCIFASSFMLSADNGHSMHPNYPEKCDLTNKPVMNGGVLIKYAGNQKYTTDGASGAFLKDLLSKAGVPYQVFFNNSNVPGGSTLGNIAQTQVSMSTADIGAAQLAMHSPYETAGVQDTWNLTQGIKSLFEN